MVTRVQADLGRFAVRPEGALAAELAALLGRPASAAERERARRLFALVLDLPAGLPIMTIHGFCQSLLKRFPLEAGVVPHFEVIEPRTAADLMREAEEEVLASLRGELEARGRAPRRAARRERDRARGSRGCGTTGCGSARCARATAASRS